MRSISSFAFFIDLLERDAGYGYLQSRIGNLGRLSFFGIVLMLLFQATSVDMYYLSYIGPLFVIGYIAPICILALKVIAKNQKISIANVLGRIMLYFFAPIMLLTAIITALALWSRSSNLP